MGFIADNVRVLLNTEKSYPCFSKELVGSTTYPTEPKGIFIFDSVPKPKTTVCSNPYLAKETFDRFLKSAISRASYENSSMEI